MDIEFEVLSDGNRLLGGACVPDAPRGLVLLLHGIPSVAPAEPGDLGYPGVAEVFAQRGWLAAWVDMRAVRGSQGYFSLEGWVRDVTAAVDHVKKLDVAAGSPCAIVGSSAGGCVASEAIRRGLQVDALALLASPASWVSFGGTPQQGVRRIVEGAGMALAPEVLQDPSEWAAEFSAITTEGAIGEVDVPVLIVHGTADTVVPVEHAALINERARNAEMHILEGAEHQLRKDPAALEIVFEWLDRVL